MNAVHILQTYMGMELYRPYMRQKRSPSIGFRLSCEPDLRSLPDNLRPLWSDMATTNWKYFAQV